MKDKIAYLLFIAGTLLDKAGIYIIGVLMIYAIYAFISISIAAGLIVLGISVIVGLVIKFLSMFFIQISDRISTANKKNKPEEQDIWGSFRGRGNSDEVLEEKANILAVVIVDWSLKGTAKLIENLEEDAKDKKPGEKFADVFFEAVILRVCFADRMANQFLETSQRGLFMSTLVDKVTSLAVEKIASLLGRQPTDEAKSELSEYIGKLHEVRKKEYNNYKIASTENEDLKGTLFWEFSKNVVDLIGFEKGIIIMTKVQLFLAGDLDLLNLPILLAD